MNGLIGLDWGTSSLRAYRFDAAGRIAETRARPWGIRQLPEGGFDAADLSAHRLWGIVFTVLTIAVSVIRRVSVSLYRTAQPVAAVLLIVAMTMTGHYGGNLTHGQTYLIEYSPLH